MKVEWRGAASDRFTPSRGGTTVDCIVMHTIVGSLEQADATFRGGSRLASAHYGVAQDRRIWNWVAESDTAWHAGDWAMNQRSIGVEHEDFGDYDGMRPDALYETSTAIVRDIALRNNIAMDRAHIIKHNEVTATHCPGTLDIDRVLGDLWKFAVLGPSRSLVTASGDRNGEWAGLYTTLAPRVGIRAELAYAQAFKETGNYQFAGIAKPEWNNPAGLGVTGAPDTGNRFPSKEAGVRAHLGHLLWYFGATHPVAGFCDLDQRHFGAHKGLGNHVVYLDGKWAVPGDDYGESIVRTANALIAPSTPAPFTDSELAFLDQRYVRR